MAALFQAVGQSETKTLLLFMPAKSVCHDTRGIQLELFTFGKHQNQIFKSRRSLTLRCSAPGKAIRKAPHPSSSQSQSRPDFTTSDLHTLWLQKNRKQRECLAGTVASHHELDLVWAIWKRAISSTHLLHRSVVEKQMQLRLSTSPCCQLSLD